MRIIRNLSSAQKQITRLIYVPTHIYVQVMPMGNITLSLPEDVHSEMRNFSEIKWSEVARKAIVEKLESLKLAESLAKKSRLTRKDVEEFSRKINAGAAKRFLG
jgi:hypothetical protein